MGVCNSLRDWRASPRCGEEQGHGELAEGWLWGADRLRIGSDTDFWKVEQGSYAPRCFPLAQDTLLCPFEAGWWALSGWVRTLTTLASLPRCGLFCGLHWMLHVCKDASPLWLLETWTDPHTGRDWSQSKILGDSLQISGGFPAWLPALSYAAP